MKRVKDAMRFTYKFQSLSSRTTPVAHLLISHAPANSSIHYRFTLMRVA